MTTLKPITAREKELLAMPTIASQLPLTQQNGNRWYNFQGQCISCKKTIADEFMRGSVRQVMPTVVVIEAVGVCVDCKIAIPFDYRLYDDRRITGKIEGRWVTFRVRKSLWSMALEYLGLTPKKRPH